MGRIAKVHGLRGELVIHPTTNVAGRFEAGTVIVVSGAPHEIVTSRPHQERVLVRLSGVDDRTAAEALRGATVEAPRVDAADDDPEPYVHQLIGRDVVETDGTARGRCEAVIANPAADLLVLDTGALVPMAFVVSTEGRIVVDPPAGLFDL